VNTIVQAVDNLTSGRLSDADINILASVFSEYLADDTAPITILSDGCPQGLRTAVRNARRRRYLHLALDIMDDAACSVKSTADRLHKDMLRLATRGRPRNEYERYLSKAIDAHPTAAITSEALWFIVREYRRSK
jgi:hypothetical protein